MSEVYAVFEVYYNGQVDKWSLQELFKDQDKAIDYKEVREEDEAYADGYTSVRFEMERWELK
jgi:hypothetical protein